LRNADGVRLTKKGTVDRRTGNYKYLKQYYEKLRTQKEQEGQGQEQGSGEVEGVHVVPSVEDETTAAVTKIQNEDTERERLDAVKQAELEARDRLVRETLERELGV
jgi:hypothetical protein